MFVYVQILFFQMVAWSLQCVPRSPLKKTNTLKLIEFWVNKFQSNLTRALGTTFDEQLQPTTNPLIRKFKRFGTENLWIFHPSKTESSQFESWNNITFLFLLKVLSSSVSMNKGGKFPGKLWCRVSRGCKKII